MEERVKTKTYQECKPMVVTAQRPRDQQSQRFELLHFCDPLILLSSVFQQTRTCSFETRSHKKFSIESLQSQTNTAENSILKKSTVLKLRNMKND